MREAFNESKVIIRFLSFYVLDWDEKAPKEILDQNAKPPNGWLENGKSDFGKSYFAHHQFFI